MSIAVLDTNTLWPGVRRDFLLSLAVEGLFRPAWSERTLKELEYCEFIKIIERGESESEAAHRARILIDRMRIAFGDSVVHESQTQAVVPCGLPDPNDEHVLAAAVAMGADVIVTENLKDFPSALLPPDFATVLPADFARDVVSVDPSRALAAAIAMANRRSDTPIEEILHRLEGTYGMVEAVALLRGAL